MIHRFVITSIHYKSTHPHAISNHRILNKVYMTYMYKNIIMLD